MNDFATASLPALAQLSVRELVIAGRAAIDEAGSYDALKAIAGKADVLRAYQRSIGASQVAMHATAELRLRAGRRMDEDLTKSEKAPADRPKTGLPNDQVLPRRRFPR
ncbi:MAG TPA: hypothetical protein VIG49_05585 [Acetobacteraceae bacterium]